MKKLLFSETFNKKQQIPEQTPGLKADTFKKRLYNIMYLMGGGVTERPFETISLYFSIIIFSKIQSIYF